MKSSTIRTEGIAAGTLAARLTSDSSSHAAPPSFVPDAAELALLSHTRRIHADGPRIFLVGSADGRFANWPDRTAGMGQATGGR